MGLLVPFPGRPLEGCGNVVPREMTVQPESRKPPVNRTRRISRPTHSLTHSGSSGTNRYPMPGSVRMCLGADGRGSSFLRSCETYRRR